MGGHVGNFSVCWQKIAGTLYSFQMLLMILAVSLRVIPLLTR